MRDGDTQKAAPITLYYANRSAIKTNPWLNPRQLFFILDESRLAYTPGLMSPSTDDIRSIHLPMNVTRISGTYTVLETDDVILAHFTGTTTINLLSVTGSFNPIHIKLLSSGTSAVITPYLGDLIDGASTKTLTAQYSSIMIMPCTFEWNILSNY